MLRFRALGSPAIEKDGVAARGAATQQKPLALIALLAVSGERGLSRDKLLGHLWPETGSDRAPHRLNQVLYALRRDLAAEDLFLGSAKLRLNPDLISSDVAEFLEAQRAGNLESAVELYGGPFLDGFGLRGASDFEQWVEQQRAGLARAYNDMVEALAAAAVARGDHRAAAAWWRRLAEDDPYSSRITLHLMHALAASGSRAEALKAARAYQALMAEELEADPSPAVVVLADQLRRQPAVSAGPSRDQPLALLVLPLEPLGADPSLAAFAAGLIEELMSGLVKLRGVRVIARTSAEGMKGVGLEAREIGRRLEAGAILEGSVRQAGRRVRVTANLVNTADGCRIWSETYERALQDDFSVQDELTGVMMEDLRRAVEAMNREEPPGA